ncbi:hypothetical protein IGI04_039410 [Brassica rapa subsp. trilocularis]|uniref:Protein kinase domain-containing protein n=3 Tax=Brassica TaxID=3705 RepID=A0ABQ8BMU8_BRANA|nr:uncharacterized protein LOC103844252 [Brassica rapa]XP_013665038.2 uncharacterized protein LOC106369425 [Brassica napus]KAG5374814.1 hypothetical protein IGI04_039410 [Brassica rapa subsp. trilocularis]KAH0905575.1 hypothetical protein HID58_037402 [Brassica napus]
MEGDTPGDTKKNEHHQLMNVNNDVSPSSLNSSPKSRNLLRKKDGRCLAVLSSGKCLQIFKNSPKVSCSHEFSTSSPSHFLRKPGADSNAADQSRKVISLPSNNTFSSPSRDVSQGTLQFTMRANGMPRFVFKLDNQKDVYVASLSSKDEDQSGLEYSYMIHLQRRESSSSSLLVGRIKVSTLSSGSLLNERFIERKFVLFSNNCEHSQTPCKKKNRGLCEKVVGVMKNNNEQMQQPNFDHEQVNLLENNLPPNLEMLAIIVKQEFLEEEEEEEEEETGGWGLKFLRKSTLVRNESGSSRSKTSVDVVVPSGIHGGPCSSLIERWKSQGNCDCGGWDLGCSLTLLNGQLQNNNLLELFIEGSKHDTTVLRMEQLPRGRYFVQYQTWLSALQSISVALAFIHSHRAINYYDQ